MTEINEVWFAERIRESCRKIILNKDFDCGSTAVKDLSIININEYSLIVGAALYDVFKRSGVDEDTSMTFAMTMVIGACSALIQVVVNQSLSRLLEKK